MPSYFGPTLPIWIDFAQLSLHGLTTYALDSLLIRWNSSPLHLEAHLSYFAFYLWTFDELTMVSYSTTLPYRCYDYEVSF